MSTAAVKSIGVHTLAIPMRRSVEHAASQRDVAEPIVVAVELNSGVVGYGETLPRPYVTGETIDSVGEAIERLYGPALLDFHPACFPDALEAIDGLPWRFRDGERGSGPISPAARAAVELALLDAYSRHFLRPISDAVGWMGFSDFGSPGSIRDTRYSGVLASRSVSGTLRTLRLMWWYGLRDFKVKVGEDGEADRLSVVARYLSRPIARGRATLRVDANGGWNLSQAIERLGAWRSMQLASVEQPLAKGDEDNLPELKSCVHQPLMYDESLVTMADADKLIALQVADGFNIRLSKCGGFLPALKLARLAQRNGIMVQLGCMVGETSILSSAGRRFLEVVPHVRFVEGSFGSFLLRDDIVRSSVRFGYGGRSKTLKQLGWGTDVDTRKLAQLCTTHTTFVM